MGSEYTIRPVGFVRIREGAFSIELDKENSAGLKELEAFSHVNVFWWCHLLDDEESRKTLQCEKPYKKGPSQIGVFATRSEYRPNPIALTAVPILDVDLDEGIIHIPYIDAEDGTPVIDLKPYQPCVDRIRDVSVPEWCDHWPKWYEDSADFDWESEFTFED